MLKDLTARIKNIYTGSYYSLKLMCFILSPLYTLHWIIWEAGGGRTMGSLLYVISDSSSQLQRSGGSAHQFILIFYVLLITFVVHLGVYTVHVVLISMTPHPQHHKERHAAASDPRRASAGAQISHRSPSPWI